ncbi:MAG TPA: OmpA family protein [Acetobacteraceae bacterium]|nr:OmpA family protein [Acetobacteraceae bacterium]
MHRRVLLAAPIVLAACTAAPPSAPARSVVVFFTADSAALDDPARNAVREAAGVARANPAGVVRVRGFAAPDTGTAAFNRSLAQTRAQAVADGLVAAGVPATRIRIESRGAVPYELMPTEARRVEIAIGT